MERYSEGKLEDSDDNCGGNQETYNGSYVEGDQDSTIEDANRSSGAEEGLKRT